MTIAAIKKLHAGDEVFWNDPDEGKCSRIYRIQTIEVRPSVSSVIITEPDGSVLECFASELS